MGRIAEFREGKKYDIYIHCNDPKKWCEKDYNGTILRVGGYAWTYSSWFGAYTSINLCPPFFTLDTLQDKLSDIDRYIERGDFRGVREAAWQKNMAQYFLHEMMHLNQTSGDSPHSTYTRWSHLFPSQVFWTKNRANNHVK